MNLRLLVFLLFAGVVPAQVTVTGLVTDAGGNPATSGYVQFDITPKASSVQYFVPGLAAIAPQTTQCGINGVGQVQNLALSGPCKVWGNDVITPGNTLYKVTFAPGGQISNAINNELITGLAYNLNNPVFAQPVQTSPQQGTVFANPFQTNILPIATNTYNIGSPLMQYAAVYASQFFQNGATLPGTAGNNVWLGSNTFNSTLTSNSNFIATAGQNAVNFYNDNHRVFIGPDTNKYTTLSQGLADPFCSTSTASCQINLLSTFAETFTSTYNLGTFGTKRQHIRGLPGANFTCNITNNTQCFSLSEQSAITGEIPGGFFSGGGLTGLNGGFILQLAPTANVSSLIGINDNADNNGMIRLDDFMANAGNGAVTSDAVVSLKGIFNFPILQNFWINNAPGVGLRVKDGGPVSLFNVWVGGTVGAGSQPCVFETGSQILVDLHMFGGLCNGAGTSQALISVNGHGTTNLGGVGFDSVFLENPSATNVTAVKIADASGVGIHDGQVLLQATDTLLDISETNPGTTCAIALTNYVKASTLGSAAFVINHISGFTDPGSAHHSSLLYYGYGGDINCPGVPWTLDSSDMSIYGTSNNPILSIPARTGVPPSSLYTFYPTAPAFGPGGLTISNHADAAITPLILDSGLTASQNIFNILSDRGVAQWYWGKSVLNSYFVQDATIAKTRIAFGVGVIPANVGCSLCLGNTEHVGWRDAANGSDHLVGEIQKVSVNISSCATTGGATPWTGAATCTVAWPSAFADANYIPVCTAGVANAGVPILQGFVTISAANVQVIVQQATGVNASFATIDCIGVHN